MTAIDAFVDLVLCPTELYWDQFAKLDPAVALLVFPVPVFEKRHVYLQGVFRKEALQVFLEHGYLNRVDNMTDRLSRSILWSSSGEQVMASLMYLLDVGFKLDAHIDLIYDAVTEISSSTWWLCEQLHRKLGYPIMNNAWRAFLNQVDFYTPPGEFIRDGVRFFLENGFVPTPENTPYTAKLGVQEFPARRLRFIHANFGFPLPPLNNVIAFCFDKQLTPDHMDCITELYGVDALDNITN